MKNIDIVRHIYIIKILLEKGANTLIYKDSDLTENSFMPLKMISEGVDTISEIKKFSTESSASLTQKMNKLEKLKLITRHINKTDKRKWNFRLSTKGKIALNKVLTKEEKALKKLFVDFSETEKEVLEKSLDKLQIKLQDKLNINISCTHNKKKV